MAPVNAKPMGTCHVVAMPYPGKGHVNPMMNLCKLLLVSPTNGDRTILITFVVTEEWFGFIGSEETRPANIRLATIPNVLPSELVRAADMPNFLQAVMTKMEEPFEKLLDQLEPPPTAIIADTFLYWAVDVGNRRNIPVASLWPMSASVFSIFHHFQLFVQNGHFPIEISERGDESADYIPGLSPIRLADLPTIFHGKEQKLLHEAMKGISKVANAQYLLFSSFFEFEAPVIGSLKSDFPFPLYSLGPLVPYLDLNPIDSPSHYLEWLDSQPEGSILYISLGSFLSVTSEQMDEIACGLRASGVRFLWVARGEASRLKVVCGDGGIVVPWCDQLRVLCHSSIGGFWSHCGWNSTLESVFAGVPLLTFPLLMDQIPNRKFIVKDLKIGVEVENRVRTENLVTREEICKLVRRFMDPESSERKEMMRRAKQLQEMSRQAIGEGGSSRSNLEAFINDISSHLDH